MEELDLKELANIFWNKKIIIILITLIAIVMGVIYTIAFTTPVYSTSTTLVLATSNGAKVDGVALTEPGITTTDLTLNSKLVATYSELIKSKNILGQVVSNLNLKSINENIIRDNVKVSSVPNTEIIKITVTNANPEYSAKIANEIAKVFTAKVKEIYNIENIQVVDEAEIPEEPSNINHEKDVIMFVMLGIIISILYVIISAMLDTTIKTQNDIEKMFDIPIIASIPMTETSLQKKKGGNKQC